MLSLPDPAEIVKTTEAYRSDARATHSEPAIGTKFE